MSKKRIEQIDHQEYPLLEKQFAAVSHQFHVKPLFFTTPTVSQLNPCRYRAGHPQGTYPQRILVDLSGAAWKSAEAIREQRKRSRVPQLDGRSLGWEHEFRVGLKGMVHGLVNGTGSWLMLVW